MQNQKSEGSLKQTTRAGAVCVVLPALTRIISLRVYLAPRDLPSCCAASQQRYRRAAEQLPSSGVDQAEARRFGRETLAVIHALRQSPWPVQRPQRGSESLIQDIFTSAT